MRSAVRTAIITLFSALSGITASAAETPEHAVRHFSPGDDWIPFVFDWAAEHPAVWDFRQDVPAGKHGFVEIKDAHFHTGGERIRFWGVNISGKACFPSRDDAPRIARFLRRYGINAVRLTHFDAGWADGIVDYSNKEDITLKTDRLDLLFNFIAHLKANGVYIFLDGYHDFSFAFRAFSHLSKDWRRRGGKFLLLFSKEMRAFHNRYLRLLFTTVNPHTGLSLADEPALAGVQMLNETNLASRLRTVKTISDLPEKEQDAFSDAWTEWTAENKFAQKYDDAPEQTRKMFLSSLETAYFSEMRDYYRNDLGVKAPLSTTSCYVGAFSLPSALEGDFTEGHAYYGHPTRREVDGRKLPVIAEPAYLNENYNKFIPFLLSQKIGFQPFVVGEWNVCVPERFDGPLLMAILGRIQDIDGLFLYTLAQYPWETIDQRAIGSFTGLKNASVMLNMVPAALIYRKGLVPTPKERIGIDVPVEALYGGKCPPSESAAGRFGKVYDAEGQEIIAAPEAYNYRELGKLAFLAGCYVLPEVPGSGETGVDMLRLPYHERFESRFSAIHERLKTNTPYNGPGILDR